MSRELGDKRGIASNLAGLGGMAAGVGLGQEHGQRQEQGEAQTHRQAERGAKLLGTAQVVLEAMGAVMEPQDRMVYERAVASVRAQLSEEGFEKAWAEGRAMSMEQAIEYALEKTGVVGD